MNKPIIGITFRDAINDNREIYKVNKSIVEKVKENGGIPILILEYNETILDICKGFIIPGGNTWNKLDESIILYALNNNKPLLGICAGMQALGNLMYFNSDKSDKTIKVNSISNINHNILKDCYIHKININKGILFDILGKKEIEVNSRHNDTIVNNSAFKVEAISDDNIIEAISLNPLVIGVQWHPEDLQDENSDKLFKYLIEKAKF